MEPAGTVDEGPPVVRVRVATELARRTLPDGVDVRDFGIRGMDLTDALGDRYDAAILVDAAPRGEPPGTVSVIEPEIDATTPVTLDTHGMDPVRVLRLARELGPVPSRMLVVACDPDTVLDGADRGVRDRAEPAGRGGRRGRGAPRAVTRGGAVRHLDLDPRIVRTDDER